MISLIWKFYSDPVTVVPSKWIAPVERLVAFPTGVAGNHDIPQGRSTRCLPVTDGAALSSQAASGSPAGWSFATKSSRWVFTQSARKLEPYVNLLLCRGVEVLFCVCFGDRVY